MPAKSELPLNLVPRPSRPSIPTNLITPHAPGGPALIIMSQAVSATGNTVATYTGINSGQHISGQNLVDQSIHNHYSSSPGIYPGIDLLLNSSAPSAAVDAKDRAYSPRCFPGTREQYIEDIVSWATATSDYHSPLIYRMKGPAGVGKSAIAQTCAERVKKQGTLGAAFFFSINGCKDHTRFFPTVAYQLSTVLSEYKQILNDRILNDKTIVDKTIAAQFEELITEPLQELKLLGKDVGTRTVFIDGLDECQSPDAQSEIIEVIAGSIRDGTTPFRWAFFSRAEAHIEATFNLEFINPLCRTVELPVSRQADQEIKLYLEGGFKNILRRQNLSFSSPWPPLEAIQKLVNASAGLYAYPATVLRFVDSYSAGDPKEALAVVLDVVSQSDSRMSPLSPFAELDAFYLLIMQQIPDHILPSIQLLFSRVLHPAYNVHPDTFFDISIYFNVLQLSEATLNVMRKHLHAVLYFQDASTTLQLGTDVDVMRPYFEQRVPSRQEIHVIGSSMGRLAFHHKSFFDFLADPTRSGAFCVSSSEMQLKLFERNLQTHFVIAQCYEFVLAHGRPDSTTALSFPPKYEYCKSYIQDWAFYLCTTYVTFEPWGSWNGFFQRIPPQSLQKLSEVDYRKYLSILLRQYPGFWNLGKFWGITVVARCDSTSHFRRLGPDGLQTDNFMAFLSMIKVYKKLGIIKPYNPNFCSKLRKLFQVKHSRHEHRGLYKFGRGDKAVFWYWEFNMDAMTFYDIWTFNFTEAKEVFEAGKHEMWSHDWTSPRSQ